MKNRKFIILFLVFFMGNMVAKGQTIEQIRKIYGDAKKSIADNGKNGLAPLDIKMKINSAIEVGDDDFIDEVSELSFYFSKYRIDSSLGYPDASSCYFVTENWTSNGHIVYREILFDPNEGYLLFSYMRAETHAGFVVESRYYYDANGHIIDQKHMVGGQKATADAQAWSTAEGDRELAGKYLAIFETLMNEKDKQAAGRVVGQKAKSDPARMKFIRDTYAKAKEKVEINNKSDIHRDLQIVIRDQSWGPPEVTDLKFYYNEVPSQSASGDASLNYHCYFVSGRHHNNGMGLDVYNEYLFTPQNHSLLFSYCRSFEENQKNEWRYYYDDNGHCIEAKIDAQEHDNGAEDMQAAKRYVDLFYKICNVVIR